MKNKLNKQMKEKVFFRDKPQKAGCLVSPVLWGKSDMALNFRMSGIQFFK